MSNVVVFLSLPFPCVVLVVASIELPQRQEGLSSCIGGLWGVSMLCSLQLIMINNWSLHVWIRLEANDYYYLNISESEQSALLKHIQPPLETLRNFFFKKVVGASIPDVFLMLKSSSSTHIWPSNPRSCRWIGGNLSWNCKPEWQD